MKKILIIDDAVDIVTSLVDLLEETGYKTYTAFNAVSALSITRNIVPDLILCDVFMPEMDGYQYLKEIRKESATANIPVIILSAGADKINIEKGKSAGVFSFIIKPYNSLELLSLIKKAVNK